MGGLLGVLLVALAGGGPVPATPTSEAPADAVPPLVVHALVLDGAIQDDERVHEELGLRLGARMIVSGRPPVVLPEGPFIWVGIVATDADVHEIRLIVSDGRGYVRVVQAGAEQRARVVAGAIANMVDGIESNRLAPQQTDVAVPLSTAGSEPVASERAAPEPAPPEPASPRPEPAGVTPVPARPLGWLGVVAGADVTFGVGRPSAVAGIAGVGGSGAVQFVHRTGALVAAQLRGITWRADALARTRIRLAALAGYVWQPGRFEIAVAAGPTLEFLRVDAQLATPSGTRRPNVPLVGGVVLARPAYAVFERPHRVRLLLGAAFEGGGAAEARAPAGVVQIYAATPTGPQAIARAGGLELSIALNLEARFALGGG